MASEDSSDRFRNRLALDLARVDQALADAAPGCATQTLDQSRVGRLSRMDAMQQQALASGMRERLAREKARLEAAIERIRTGQFGSCCGCGDPIAAERLQADPAAPFCGYCQEEIDERRKSD